MGRINFRWRWRAFDKQQIACRAIRDIDDTRSHRSEWIDVRWIERNVSDGSVEASDRLPVWASQIRRTTMVAECV